MHTTENITWMTDEIIGSTPPSNWEDVIRLEKELVGIVGNKSLKHEIADPIVDLSKLEGQLRNKHFSCIFDLTGWLTPTLASLFRNTPIVDDFRISRVRDVSTPDLITTGHIVSHSPQEIAITKTHLNLERPLIVDDVSFSAATSISTMNLWGLDPTKTTHAFLIGNAGQLGRNPGAIPTLQKLGSQILIGREIVTPRNDGWHLKDLHKAKNLTQAFILALLFQELIARNGHSDPLAQSFFSNKTFIDTIFPENFSTPELNNLARQGKFLWKEHDVRSGKKDNIHARNPFLWASHYFNEHLDTTAAIQEKDHIIGILEQIHSLTSDPKGVILAPEEIRARVIPEIREQIAQSWKIEIVDDTDTLPPNISKEIATLFNKSFGKSDDDPDSFTDIFQKRPGSLVIIRDQEGKLAHASIFNILDLDKSTQILYHSVSGTSPNFRGRSLGSKAITIMANTLATSKVCFLARTQNPAEVAACNIASINLTKEPLAPIFRSPSSLEIAALGHLITAKAPLSKKTVWVGEPDDIKQFISRGAYKNLSGPNMIKHFQTDWKRSPADRVSKFFSQHNLHHDGGDAIFIGFTIHRKDSHAK